MPHELSISANGDAEMMYVGRTPWHGLGTQLESEVTAKEAIEAARMNYQVEQQTIFRQNPTTGLLTEYPDRYAVVRTDTDVPFDIVSGQYEIVQNEDHFTFFDEIIGQGQAVYHTAGALRGGRIIWILVKLPETIELIPGDPIEQYILMSSSHDRSKSLEIAITPIRVVCANTLRVGMSAAKNIVQIRHTQSIHSRAVEARQALGLTDAYHQLMMESLGVLANTPMSPTSMAEYATAFLNVNPDREELHAFSQDARERLCELFEVGRGQDIPGVANTAYAAFNATTEFLDNYKRVQVASESGQHSPDAQDRRLYRSWFGRGQSQRDRSFNLLQNFARTGPSAFEGVYAPRERRRRPRVQVIGG